MGICLSKCPLRRAHHAYNTVPKSSRATSAVLGMFTSVSKNLIAPHPVPRHRNLKQTALSMRELSSTPSPTRLQRSLSTTAISTTMNASLYRRRANSTSDPLPPLRKAMNHPLHLTRSETRLFLKLNHKRRKKYKPITIGLNLLLRDEQVRIGYFKYLRAVAHMDKLHIDDEKEDNTDQVWLIKKQGPSRVKLVNYREDCALFWLEIGDLLKLQTSSASGGAASFQMGLMCDLYDVYIAKGAPRLLPMVAASEREALAQYLADQNAEQALLILKMLLLDVLDVVKTNFDEYVREPGHLGYSQALKSTPMRNVLAQLAKRVAGGGFGNGDRRAHLHHILSTPALCRMFREFLEARNSVENLLFIIDALAFEDLVNIFKHTASGPLVTSGSRQASSSSFTNLTSLQPNTEETDILPIESHQDFCTRQAHKIFNKYVRYGSKAEVCLSTAVKDKLLERLAQYPLSADIFSDAVMLCSAELVHAHLDAFYRTVAYLSYRVEAKKKKKQGNGKQSRVMEGSIVEPQDFGVQLPTAPPIDSGIPIGRGNKQGPLGLTEILDGAGVHSFREFLRELEAENTLFFYKEVCEFQRLPHIQQQYIQMRARRIFDKYVRRGARLELELPVEIRRNILWKLSTPTETMFTDAQQFVLRQWETRDLPNFRFSPLYQEMLDQIAASPAAPPPAISHDGEEQNTSNASSSGFLDVSKLSLREFLELEQLCKYFRRFLEREQCANELYFYFEVTTFQQFPTSDYLSRQARKIFNRFCDPRSREFVPFASKEIYTDLQRHLANPSPAMFNKAQEQIFNFLATTLFPKFQQSEIYRGIRVTRHQLRAARRAAIGGSVVRTTNVKVPNHYTNPTSTNVGRRSISIMTPTEKLEDRASDNALSEAGVTVAMILENPETRALFLFFSEEIFCTESIYFWIDCYEFKDIPHRSYLKLRAQKIYRKYICGRAKLQVNLESALIRVIESNLDNPTRTLFVPAQLSITKMLERDTLPKFRHSKYFQPCFQLLLAAAATH